MKRVILSAALLLGLMKAGYSQSGSSEYKSAIGGRISSGYYDLISASYKTFITQHGALEFNLGFRPKSNGDLDWVSLAFSGVYQHHFDINGVPGLKWFVGGGLTAYNSFSNYDDYRGFGLGIFPTGGVDYKFGNIPLNLSFDLRPTISLTDPYPDAYKGYDTFNGGNVGISARYTFR